MKEEFSRSERLIGAAALEKLKNARVAVFGVGGVGGYVVEALARSGVGSLDLVDSDTVALSNLNRQLLALHSTLGESKVAVAAQRVLDINPTAKIHTHKIFYLPETAHLFDFCAYDYVVDAIDTVSGKLELVKRAKEAGIPIISSMGAGGKLDPCRFEVTDIYKTSVCPLAKVMRRLCRENGIKHLKVVYSKEERRDPPKADGERLPPASMIFAPAAAGLAIAAEVVCDLISAERTL